MLTVTRAHQEIRYRNMTRHISKDVKTGFLTQPVIGLRKPVIYRLSDYMMSRHVAECWLKT